MIAVPGTMPTSIRRLIVAHPEDGYLRLLCRYFNRLGWRVYLAPSGTVARRLARSAAPAVVVLATNGTEESGWLTCAKLTRELPGQKVVLIDNEPRREGRRLSKFVGGAALVSRTAGVGVLIDQVQDAAEGSSRGLAERGRPTMG